MTDLGRDDRVGDYVLESPIGRGAFGQVWRAHHFRTNEPAALKVLGADSASSADASARLDLERLAAAAARDSSHVVRVLAIGQEPQPYLVMEYVAGSNLRDALRRRGPLPQEEVIAIGLAIADALRALHRVRIIHRDVKPANVLLDPAGGVKLSDFGVAKILGYEETVTLADHTPLSAPYAAPEAWDGAATHQSDLYSLGCVLFELLSGSPPFAGDLLELYGRHHAEEPDLARLPVDTAPSLRELIRLCLKKAGAERPASAAECVRLLERARGELRREPATFGPWVRGDRHPTQPWAWRCSHERTAEIATVELVFGPDESIGEAIRAAVAANPALVLAGAERLLGANRLLLAEGEGWANVPDHNVIFWIARREETIPTVERAIGLAQLVTIAASLQELIEAANAVSVRLTLDGDTVVVRPDWTVHARRPGLPPPPRFESTLSAFKLLRELPGLTTAASNELAVATSLPDLLARLQAPPAASEERAAAPPSPSVRGRFLIAGGLLALLAVVVVVAAIFALGTGGKPRGNVTEPATATTVPLAADACTALKLPAPIALVRATCPGNVSQSLNEDCPRAQVCDIRKAGDATVIGVNDLVAAVVDQDGKLKLTSADSVESKPQPDLAGITALAWSPDGRYLVLLTSQSIAGEPNGATASQVALLNPARPADRGIALSINDLGTSVVRGRISAMKWSRDGKGLYFLWLGPDDASVFRFDLPYKGANLDFGQIRSSVPPGETLLPPGISKLALNFRDFGSPDLRPAAFDVQPDGSLVFQLCLPNGGPCSLGRWDGVKAKVIPAGAGTSFFAPIAPEGKLVTLRAGPGTETHIVSIGNDGSVLTDHTLDGRPANVDLRRLGPLALGDSDRGLLAATDDGRLVFISIAGEGPQEWGKGKLATWFTAPETSPTVLVRLGAQPYITPTAGPSPTPPIVGTTPLPGGNSTDLEARIVASSCARGSELVVSVKNLGPGAWPERDLFLAIDSATGGAIVSNKAFALAPLAVGQSQEVRTGYTVQERIVLRIDSVGSVNDPNRANNRAECAP